MKNIMIAGAGVLGSQIAYQTALSGFNVSVYNHHIDTAERRIKALKADYERDLHLTADEFQKGLDNIKIITDDIATAVKDADLMIEALPESLDLKEHFYEEVSKLAPEKTIFASNSSTFIPSQLAPFTDRPAKFLNMHFANQIWKFNVVEIMGTAQTDSQVIEEATDFSREIKMVPIVLHKEQHGYILNSLLIPLLASGLNLWAKGIAEPEMIDKDWMISTGAPMGPFGILDMVGLRTAAQIERNTYAQTKDESHKAIADKMDEMIKEGHEGKESGQGFYTYPNPAFMDPKFLKY
ncbi:3-hydroxyacyl-CoA dehydrogenase [Limosilactobacillus sp. RRLNB_1_1]|uniref:3-hydroxyacyl-CoA dehydrogenase n=1 Tax=Limosilactobacillus albertensis TaxID=2759752 RepID=A0A7W3TSM0_9LACO|nr:3-hydroxyacyl-CoA dehydrogenase [Limosilactobacillus albertensis]MBB1070099.1 3-hydroxyacyl-CoA dehydrogenase [Limosilactobacillus albertensis]MCD7117754.1 3-hydroxyacyl-CoA dehydrogenase [Limosilactobacillus albertensis]MCD7128301.1 3-hydroxyacyl-CoA dehydrogenase [Limosilactobacillus albertensis]